MSEDQRQVLSIGQIDEFRHLLSVTQMPVPFSDDWDLQIDGAHEFARAIESATLAALAQQAQAPVANDRDCPHCNYTGGMHCGDVAKTHGGILNPKDCSHAKLFGSRITTPPAPQPAVPADCDVRKIMLDVVSGDGSGLEVYAKNVSDVKRVLSEMGEKLESLLCEKACPPLEDTMLLNWLESNPATTVTEEGGQWFLGELLCQSLRDAIRKGIRFQAPTAEDKP